MRSRLLTAAQAAARLGVSKGYLYRLTRAGKLPGRRITPKGRLRFTGEDLDALWLRTPAPAPRGGVA